jgi:hypothetical protein
MGTVFFICNADSDTDNRLRFVRCEVSSSCDLQQRIVGIVELIAVAFLLWHALEASSNPSTRSGAGQSAAHVPTILS